MQREGTSRFALFCAKKGYQLGGFGGFSVEAPEPDSGSFSGRFGSDSGGLPHWNSDFWSL